MLLKEAAMVGIVIVLVILWFLGVLTKNTLGGLLHILLVVAVIFLLINVIRGRGL
jgi:ABC-type multidrug transport system permease subunit